MGGWFLKCPIPVAVGAGKLAVTGTMTMTRIFN